MNSIMKEYTTIFLITLMGFLVTVPIASAGPGPYSWRLGAEEGVPGPEPAIPSNSIIDLDVIGPHLFIASGKGFARFTPDALSAVATEGEWLTITSASGFGRGGVSGLASGVTSWGDTLVWAATAFDTLAAGEELPAGGGVGFSSDFGESWTWLPQPVDSRDETDYSPTTVVIQNVTYDIAMQGDTIWIASFGGGLRYTVLTEAALDDPSLIEWTVRPPDDQPFNPASILNHIAFSVTILDTTIWTGSSGGVSRSRDGGESWILFDHEDADTTTMSGDWIVALGAQHTSGNQQYIWASTRATTEKFDFDGVSVSFNDGLSWKRVLGSIDDPVTANNLAFDDTVVFAATNQGLFKSLDFGQTWGKYPPIIDNETGDRVYSDEILSVAKAHNRLYVGTYEGLAVSNNDGLSWNLLRTAPSPGHSGTPDSYAYPNPYSPDRYERVRFRYSLAYNDAVTLEIYDFAMELLVRPVKNEMRTAGEHDEVWNGRGPGGRQIANGVYFYRITGGGEERWGKVMILD